MKDVKALIACIELLQDTYPSNEELNAVLQPTVTALLAYLETYKLEGETE